MSELCCICIETVGFFSLNDRTADNTTLISKLKFILPEMEWKDSWFICSRCCESLSQAHNFCLMCINSNRTRTRITMLLNDPPKTSHRQECVLLKEELAEELPVRTSLEDEEINNEEEVKDVVLSNDLNFNIEEKIDAEQVMCRICLLKFDNYELHFQHVLKEHEDLSIEQCKFNTFLVKLKQYTGKNLSYICTYCDKPYQYQWNLNHHVKIHLNNREFECTICLKRFNTRKYLTDHKALVHTDNNGWKYVCTYCGKRHPTNYRLTRHIRVHTGSKPFKCSRCDKEYKEKRNLQSHVLSVHKIVDINVSIKKYSCPLCPKSYFIENRLTEHMFLHNGEKPYSCHICSKYFRCRDSVRKHLKNMHDISNKPNI